MFLLVRLGRIEGMGAPGRRHSLSSAKQSLESSKVARKKASPAFCLIPMTWFRSSNPSKQRIRKTGVGHEAIQKGRCWKAREVPLEVELKISTPGPSSME